MTWRTQEEKEQWADDHGYYHWMCRQCGRSGWTDTVPDCGCEIEPEEPMTEEEPFSDQSGDDHLRHLMNEAKKLK